MRNRTLLLAAAVACLPLLAGCTDEMRLHEAHAAIAQGNYCTTGDDCMVVAPGQCRLHGEYLINKKETQPVMKAINDYLKAAAPCGVSFEITEPAKPIERFVCSSQKCVAVHRGDGAN